MVGSPPHHDRPDVNVVSSAVRPMLGCLALTRTLMI